MAAPGQRVKTADGSKAGLHPTGNQGTVISVSLANTRMYGGKLMTLDEALVLFDGQLIASLQTVSSLQ